MSRYYPANPFERYADDVVVHCKTLIEAEHVKSAITSRMRACKLELHPEKTKIVYCKDDNRKDNYHQTQFDFLSFTFRKRTCRTKDGKLFNGFNPAVSLKSRKAILDTIRSWEIHRINPVTQY